MENYGNLFKHKLFSRWVQTGSLQADSHISSLSWNLEGTRLLTGGVTIQMWHERITNKEEDPARKSNHFIEMKTNFSKDCRHFHSCYL